MTGRLCSCRRRRTAARLADMRRLVDVVCQHWRWLLMGLGLVPALLGAVAFGLSSTRVVVATVRLHSPSFVADVLPDALLGISPRGSPAGSAATLIEQLVATDWFAAQVADGANSRTSASSSPGVWRTEIADLHTHLTVVPEGTSTVALRYSTADLAQGLALVDALIARLGNAITAIQSERTAAAARVAAGAQPSARDDVQRAVAEVRRYADSFAEDGEALRRDPTFLRLAAAAEAATAHDNSLSTLVQNSQLASAALPELRQTVLAVDRPAVEPGTRLAAGIRAALLGAAAVAVLELAFVYVVALHDPRLRDVDDVRGFVKGPCLISVPSVDPSPHST